MTSKAVKLYLYNLFLNNYFIYYLLKLLIFLNDFFIKNVFLCYFSSKINRFYFQQYINTVTAYKMAHPWYPRIIAYMYIRYN